MIKCEASGSASSPTPPRISSTIPARGSGSRSPDDPNPTMRHFKSSVDCECVTKEFSEGAKA